MSAARGVLFDLDGTLYHQPPLRVLMAAELGLRPWLQRRPTEVPRLWHALGVFREMREELRSHAPADGSLDERQYTVAAGRAGVPVEFMREAVREWIFERPLPYVHAARRRDARAVFERLRDDGVLVGVFSDYPVTRQAPGAWAGRPRLRAALRHRRRRERLQAASAGIPGSV